MKVKNHLVVRRNRCLEKKNAPRLVRREKKVLSRKKAAYNEKNKIIFNFFYIFSFRSQWRAGGGGTISIKKIFLTFYENK